MQKYAVPKFNHLQIDFWPNFLACQPKSVLWHHTIADLFFQLFKLLLQKMGPACLYRSTSRKTFPLSTREIMTCLCNTFLKTFFKHKSWGKALICDLEMNPSAKIPDPASTSTPAFGLPRSGGGQKTSNWTLSPKEFSSELVWYLATALAVWYKL